MLDKIMMWDVLLTYNCKSVLNGQKKCVTVWTWFCGQAFDTIFGYIYGFILY